jgi:ABC-2 type transport system ATP-binding protein
MEPDVSGSPTSDAIDVRGLRVVRGAHAVLDDLSLSIRAGTITGLLGPSGCGKTTLMRAIVGVQIVAGGEVRVLGEPAGSQGLRTRVAYVTQAPSVYPDLTVRENLRYFGAVLGEAHARVQEVIGHVSLEEHADQLVGRLSGGQRARVSLATALLGRPEVLVLDEPTVGLDPVLRGELWSRFRELADAGATLLVSSHVMDEAARCDVLLLMREGRIIADDAPASLLERTGARDVEGAFLALVAESERS